MKGLSLNCFSRAWLVTALFLPVAATQAQLPAFPGAEGFGKYTTGGRGGTVYHVTTTNDAGAGSFRDAVSVANRTIVFDVGGVIDYQAPRYAPKANITIAGQTAPGDGVTIYGDGLSFSGANNNICRFIRVRQGINGTSDTDAMGIANGNTMIFDHITASWGRDETFSVSGDITNITIQSSIISQGLQGHSAGGLVQTDGGVSILRSLYIDNDTRNPKVKGVSEFVNNVICNWETIGYNMGGDSAGESFVNVFNNYFMRGLASGSTAIGGGNTDFHIYATNNFYDGDRDGILDGSALPFANYGSMDLQSTPYPYPISYASAHSALTALKLAISDAGPSFRRDSVDELMIQQLTSWGLLGGTITSELIAPMNGPGVVRNGTPYTDTDQDGMPDFWESGTGSNPAVADNNAASPSGSGYTRLEDYLNWLAEPHGIALMNTNVVIDLRQFTRGWVIVNNSPFWLVSNPTNGTVALTNGYMAVFTPTTGLNSNASFAFTVNDADGSPVTRTMNLFFTPSAQSYTAVWHGDDLANNWNTLGDFNWHDGISLLYQFHSGEPVTFDNSGSTNPAVNLVGSLTPASVTIDSTKNYSFSGSGSLDGSMALNKTNTGTLTINNTNSYTGATTVSNGTLLVHGALNASAVTVRSSGTIGGNGRLGNSLTAVSGSTLAPGNGIGAPGTLTITNALTLSGGVTNRFDLSDDPTGTTKTNDVIRVFGNLNLSGVNTLKFTLLDSLPGNGIYTLITYSGTLSGSLANLSLSGISGTLTNPPGEIAIIVNASRPPATLNWTGNGGNNFWDTSTNVCWLNDIIADKFYFGDDVVFDNTGATNLTATLVGDLTPNSVTVDATVNYTLTGAGKITGATGLTKTNSGTLTVSTANDFTGPTIIGGGTLSVSQLAGGGAPSGIGAASSNSANLVFSGSKLSYTGGSVSTDRGATFNGSANFDITGSGTTLTENGGFIGSGSLIKSGAGTLTLTADNSFSGGTVVSNGTLALFGPSGGATLTANNYALGSGNVTLYGGTLKLFGGGLGDAGAGYGNFSRPLIVPVGATATILTPARYTMSSTLTGGGTLNMEVNYVRGTMSGNWSAFTGTINITAAAQSPGNGVGEFRVANSSGYAGATLFLNSGALITQSGSATLMEIGALGGVAGGIVGPGNSTSSGRSFRIGWNNQNATFAGQILADGANTVTKVGTGNWTLTGANTYTGSTIVDGGTLTVNNTSGSGTGTGSVTINTGATLAGNGIISGAVTINSGATVTPGTSIGTLTVNNSVTLAAGSTTRIEINKTSATKDLLDASGAMTYGGTLIVTNLSGTLAEGDSFKIFDAGSYGGSFTSSNLPPLATDLMWYTAQLTLNGSISVVSTNFNAPQSLQWIGDGFSNVWNTVVSNWVGTLPQPRAFVNGDTVVFSNAGNTTPPLNLTTNVAPAAMVVNAVVNYTLTGTGALTGTMALTKSSTGKFTVANTGTNTFSGGTTISGGSLQIGDGVSVNGNLPGNIVNNATLIYANPSALTSSSVMTGSGTLVKQGAGTLTINSTNSSYSGNVLIGGGAITLGISGAALNTGTLTLSNGGTFNFPPSSPAYFYPGTITVSSSQTGTVSSPGLGNGVNGSVISGNSSSVLNISSGVSFAGTTTAQFDSFTGTINVLSGGTLRFSPNSSGNTYGSLNPTFAVNGTLQPRNAGNTVRLGKISGSGTLSGPQSNGGTGSTTYQIGGANIDSTFNGVIASNTAVAGSLVVLQKVGTGKLTLSGGSTYTGGTTVSNGTLIVNNTTGSGTGSGSVAVRSGATLAGSGIISGATTIETGATLAPGDSLGKLTFNSTLNLASGSTNRFELNAATLTNDVVKTLGAISLNGILVVSNTSGTLAAGNSFKLFEATGYSGSFTTVILPTLNANLAWTNRLATDGTIAVISTAPATPPVFNSVTTVGSNLVVSGTNGPANGTYYVLSSTNISLPMTNWPRISTNQFNASGNFSLTNSIAPGEPQKFYRVQLP